MPPLTDSARAQVPPLRPSRGEAAAVRATVVIPTLNEEKRIGGLLETLGPAVRRRHGLEVVVSDGGSTDGTLGLARRLADRVVEHAGPGRQTISAGRNAGAAVARGGLLLFVNADVRFPDDLDGFLRAVLGAAEAGGAATCRVGVHPSEATLADRAVLGVCDVLFCGMNVIGAGMGRGECHALRRAVFEAVGGYNEALAAGEDFDLYRRVARWGRRTGEARIRFLWGWRLWEDPRRYRHSGYARTMFEWLRNTVAVTVLGRSYSEEWEPIR